MQESDVQRLISILTREFTTEWVRTNAPHGMWKALKNVPSLESGHIQKTLLGVGFKAWLSHFLAGQRKETHYKGHADDTWALNTLQTLNPELLREVAGAIERTQVHPTVLNAISKLKEQRGVSGKYAGRLCRTTPDKFSVIQASVMDAQNTSEFQFSSTAVVQDLEPHQPSIPPVVNNNTLTTGTNAESTSTLREISDFQTVSNPPARYLPTLFRPYMVSAVRKSGERAHIEMLFPYSYSLGMVCMSLAILASKVEFLALKLFGTQVDSEGDFRYIEQANGTKLLIKNEVVAQGAQDAGIVEILGPTLGQMLEVSPARKEERNQGILNTRFVTMQIPGNVNQDGILNINLGEAEAYQVKDMLFKT